MAREEILEKLEIFLFKHTSFDEECHIIYLLVEIRKLLERENNSNFPLVKFYCDWTVHTKRDRNFGIIKEIVDKIDSCFSVESHYPSRDDEIFDFLKMTELRKEFKQLFRNYQLPTNIFEEDSNWSCFVDTLTSVLSDQPILNPKEGIKSISLVSFGEGHSAINIEFNDGRTDSMAGGER